MAFQRDYVLRMIEMMGDLLRRLKMLGTDFLRQMELDAACRDQCGLPLDAAADLSRDTLAELLPPRALFVLSELLYLKLSSTAMDADAEMQMKMHILRILSSLHEEETLCEERGRRLRELMDDCDDEMTPEDYLNCARFFLAGEHLTDCEDAVFMAVEIALDKKAPIRQGKEMLQQMLHLPETTLIPGGMTREEIRTAIDDLETWEKA